MRATARAPDGISWLCPDLQQPVLPAASARSHSPARQSDQISTRKGSSTPTVDGRLGCSSLRAPSPRAHALCHLSLRARPRTANPAPAAFSQDAHSLASLRALLKGHPPVSRTLCGNQQPPLLSGSWLHRTRPSSDLLLHLGSHVIICLQKRSFMGAAVFDCWVYSCFWHRADSQ